MKYFLGYFQNRQYHAIMDSDIGTSILDVVNFTTEFPTLNALRKFLFEKKLIPHEHCELAYTIEKGPKDNRSYTTLKHVENIYLAEHKQFFSTNEVYKSLKMLEHDSEFMTFLYSAYIIKFGIDKKIKYFLSDVVYNRPKLRIVIRQLCIALKQEEAKASLFSIVEELDKEEEQISEVILYERMQKLINSIFNNTVSLTNATICLIRFLDVNRIPTILNLNNWLSREINQSYDIRIENPDEGPGIDSYFDIFYNEVLYEFDHKKREYKQINGKRKLKERSFFDLCSILADYNIKLYQDYIDEMKLANSNQPSNINNTDEDEYEEFLEEADFERIGTTSENEGIKLRKPN